MEPDIEKLIEENLAKLIPLRLAMSAESDRGCALLAISFVEDQLKQLLLAYLVPASKKENRNLFDGMGSLSTLSGKTKMAFRLGLLSKACLREIDRFREVRNDFAHNPEWISFDSPAIQDVCRELEYSYDGINAKPRSLFLQATWAVLASINHAAATVTRCEVAFDDQPSEDQKKKQHEFVRAFYKKAGLAQPGDADDAGPEARPVV
jgi:hypothetical protein